MSLVEILITTFIKRPYVFAFLAAYLVISILNHGKKPTVLFLVTGYLIAWISEGLSIRTGFPYGWYFYIYENLQGEWMNWGVPVWDSLSYTFLCFAGMSLADWICRSQESKNSKIFKTSLLGAIFVVILDIIIDPLAHQGDKWFLGRIYYYPYPGYYFNVPIANFIGWFFVAFLIISLNLTIGQKMNWELLKMPSKKIRLMGPGLYFGIFLFNFLITIYIQDWILVALGLFWISLPVYLFLSCKNSKTTA